MSCLCSLNLHRHSRPRTVSDYYCSDDDYYYNCSDASNDGNGDDDFHCQRTVCSVAGCGLRTSSLGQHLRKTHHFSLDSYNYHFHMQGNSKKARTIFERCKCRTLKRIKKGVDVKALTGRKEKKKRQRIFR